MKFPTLGRSCLLLISTFTVAFVGGCATAPLAPPTQLPADTTVPTTLPITESEPGEHVDMDGLQAALGLQSTTLGAQEKRFNSCSVGYGYSGQHACRSLNYLVVNFQLQCRDSDGTVSDVDYQLTPVVSNDVKWKVGRSVNGVTQTNSEGFGQVRAILAASRPSNGPGSARAEKLRLTVSGDFLILTVGDVRRIVAPKSWCDHN